MDVRIAFLAVPTAAILTALVSHSFRTLPRGRALLFWGAALTYGLLRGIGVRLTASQGLHALSPYVIHHPLFSIAGVSLQEVAGWSIVSYLGWWLSGRAARGRVTTQILWASTFIGSVGWAVESAAAGLGWWHWTVPLSGALPGRVPFIGLVDWFFVGPDLLLPFVLLTSPALLRAPERWLALASFPAHLVSHAFTERVSPWMPIPIFHLFHWGILCALVFLALRSRLEDRAFHHETRSLAALPILCAGAILSDVALLQLFWMREPRMLVTCLPGLALVLWGAAAPSLRVLRRRSGEIVSRSAAAAFVGAIAMAALIVHASAARADRALEEGLTAALAARDRGDLPRAERMLEELADRFTGSHVPLVLAAEIDYRTDRLAEARAKYLGAVRIKQDFLPAYRHLAAIDLRSGDTAAALEQALRGLEVQPDDLELLYLKERAGGVVTPGFWDAAASAGPEAVLTLASLAYEVGDASGAGLALDRGLVLWPDRASLRDARRSLALKMREEDR